MTKNIFIVFLLSLFLFCKEKKDEKKYAVQKSYKTEDNYAEQELHNPDSAIQLWKNTAKIDSMNQDTMGILYCYEGIYDELKKQEELPKFLDYKEKLLPLLSKREDTTSCNTYKFFATAHHKNIEPDSARKYYDLSLQIAKKLPPKNAWEVSQCYAEYAVFLTDMHDITSAKIYAKQAFLLNKNDSISMNELNLGRYFFLLGYEDSALIYFHKPILNNGLVAERYRKLSEYYRDLSEDSKKFSDYMNLFCHLNKYNCYSLNDFIKKGCFLSAKDFFGLSTDNLLPHIDSAAFYTYKLIAALDSTKPKALGRAYKYLGEVLFKQKKYQQALDTLQMALPLRKADKVGMAATYETLAEVYFSQNQIDKALESLQNGLSFSSSQPFETQNLVVATLSLRVETLELLMQKVNFLQKKDQKMALQTADSTDIFINKVRNSLQSDGSKLILADKVAAFYHTAMQLALAAGDKEKAFHFSEKSKGFLLFSSIKDLQYKIDNIPQDTLDKEQVLLQEMTWLKNKGKEAKAFDISQQLDALQKRMAIQNPKYSRLKHQTEPVTLQELQQKLTSEQAIIEYVRGEMNGAWVIAKDTSVFIGLPIEVSDSAILAFYNLMANPKTSLSTYLSKAYPFYEALILPIEKVAKQPNWIIIPDETLNYLPFEALVTSEKKDTYLLETKSISYHYSASLWKHLEKTAFTSESPNNYFIAAVDRFDNGMEILQGGDSLMETLKKAFGIGEDIFPAQKTPFINHFQQEKSYPLVCLYTHSKADDYVAEKSVIHFKDDVLNLSEVFSLRMKAGLVVLASCESGKGKVHKGEGMSSLARGFMYAGGESVLPTKWSVSEMATKDLLKLLIAELAKGTPKDKALQQAKLLYLKQNKDATPYKWAAPFLVGNTEAIHFQTTKKESNNLWGIAALLVSLASLGFYIFRRFSK